MPTPHSQIPLAPTRRPPPVNPRATSDVSVVTGVSHSASQCERGESPGKPRRIQNIVKKPFAGVSVTADPRQFTASFPNDAATMTSTVPPAFELGQWKPFSNLPPPPRRPETAGSEKSPEFVSIISSGSNESQMSYPNDDQFVDPNQHHVGYPVELSAPSVPASEVKSKKTRCYLTSEVHKLR